MSADFRVCVVVPCYNEARRLDTAAFRAALDAMDWLDLHFVDDGSSDETARILFALAALSPHRIRVSTLPVNSGKGEAVRCGMLLGMERAACVGFWDADLSAPLSELSAMRDIFGTEPLVQWVWGIRLRALGRDITRGSLRHYLGRVFASVASVTLDMGSYDTQCGAKLFRASPLLARVLSRPFLSRWIFEVEMLSRASQILSSGAESIGQIVHESPLRHWHHRDGSKVRPLDALRAIRDLWRIRREASRWRSTSA